MSWDLIEKEYQNILKQIASRCKIIFQECVESEVYDKYDPKEYERTRDLFNSVEFLVKDNTIYVYVDTTKNNYTSNVPNANYPANIWNPYWVNYGHNTETEGIFMYDNYPSRQYKEEAKRRIEKEFDGLTVEFLEEMP